MMQLQICVVMAALVRLAVRKWGFLVGGAAIDEDANKVAPIIILIVDASTRDVHVKCVLLCPHRGE